jgi:hypothetical protein
MFLNSCEGEACFLEDSINEQVIDRVCAYNGKRGVSRLKHAPVNADDLKDLASFVARLVAQGVVVPTPQLENGLLKLAKLPERKIEEGGEKVPNVSKDKLIPDYITEAYLTQKRRREYPASYFLQVTPEGERKFPVKDPKTGNYHYGLVRAAITRAAQYHYPEIEKKAKAIFDRYFKKKKDISLSVLEKDVEGKEVFGIVLVPDQEDGDGDSYTKEAVREACYEFNKDFMNQSYRHNHMLTKNQVSIIESYVAPCEMKFGERVVKDGTWLMRSAVNDVALREEVKTGKLKGFSIGGFGVE